jgi:IS1 family transposase
MANTTQLKVVEDILSVFKEKELNTSRIKIILKKSRVEVFTTDNYINFERAFNKLSKKYTKIEWKTRHNDAYVYKLIIK